MRKIVKILLLFYILFSATYGKAQTFNISKVIFTDLGTFYYRYKNTSVSGVINDVSHNFLLDFHIKNTSKDTICLYLNTIKLSTSTRKNIKVSAFCLENKTIHKNDSILIIKPNFSYKLSIWINTDLGSKYYFYNKQCFKSAKKMIKNGVLLEWAINKQEKIKFYSQIIQHIKLMRMKSEDYQETFYNLIPCNCIHSSGMFGSEFWNNLKNDFYKGDAVQITR